MTKTTASAPPTSWRSTDDVLARYQRPGVHATVVMVFPAPGQVETTDGAMHVRRSELVDAGADHRLARAARRAVRGLEPRGEHRVAQRRRHRRRVLLADRPDRRPSGSMWSVPGAAGRYDELADRTPVVIAVVDHLGADLSNSITSTSPRSAPYRGEEVEIDPQVRGDQAGYERRRPGGVRPQRRHDGP